MKFVESPRHASVLLVLGVLPPVWHQAARRVHDQIPAPRVTVVLDATVGEGARLFPDAVHVTAPCDLGGRIASVHGELTNRQRGSETPFGPAKNPVPWQGVGPHGQGGEGMMGGRPYGRPMAMTGTDLRDGLELDRLELPLGPFVRWLPPGLGFDLVLQGDVVQEARVIATALQESDEPDLFDRAQSEPVGVAELEIERARQLLFATVDLLTLHGLSSQALRVVRLATQLQASDEGRVRRLRRILQWTGALWWGTKGVGISCGEDAALLGGPVARAAGQEDDARCTDPAYAGLDFVPARQRNGDAWSRWRQRLTEAAQSLRLAKRAGARRRSPGPPLECPRGASARKDAERMRILLERLAVGQSFDTFATTIVSLDLDVGRLAPKASSANGDDADREGPAGRSH